MRTVGLLRNTPRDYAWGSRDAIARLQGRPAPSERPEAELWMGAHPRGPSEVEVDGTWVSLFELVQRHPEEILGAPALERFGRRLPFLLKLLAADKPLSIQAHPDAAQARAGFARENALGIPLSSPGRSYVDDGHKPELLCALSPFTALCGFRPPLEVAEAMGRLAGAALEPELAGLRARPDAETLRRFFETLMQLDMRKRQAVAATAARAAEAAGDGDPAVAWVRRLAGAFGDDVGVLAPLFLRLVELAPGEAIFLPAGVLHTYLGGLGIELMANSDNVLRCGLTPKHVDVPELCRIVRFEAPGPEVIRPVPRGPVERVYPTPAAEFELEVLDLGPGRPFDSAGAHGVEIVLCTEGGARVHDLAGRSERPLARGAAALIPAAVTRYRVEGEARVYKASLPLIPPS